MDARELAALELAARTNIVWNGQFWSVPSTTTGNYRVDAGGKSCTCEDWELRGKPCKHILAVDIVRLRNAGRPVPPSPTADTNAPKKIRKTYKQDWPNYNAAQTSERWHVTRFLSDLCGTIAEPERTGRGRPPVPLADAVFAAVYKVYSTLSARRFTCDLRDAERDGHRSHAPHYNVVLRVLENPAVTPILRRLVIQSAAPLSAIETTFALDSSGFGTNRFVKWFDTKHGTERRQADWVKVHVCVGTKTNVVTAVEIGDEHDGQHFPALVRTTAETFRIADVTADKAYLSRDNLELVEKEGGTTYVPFKVNSRGDKQGPVWERMFHYFHLHRDEFLKHYHQRSNVESAFSGMKRKFGDAIRAKTDVAMVNESLAKVLCWNLSVLVHEMFELGIDPQFGERKEEADSGERPWTVRFPVA
jgi:transposase